MDHDAAVRLARLALALRYREADVESVLTAVATGPAHGELLVGASVHGRALEVVVPEHPLARADGGDGLRVRVDGDQVERGIVRVGPCEMEPAWFDVVDQLCAVGGQIASRTQWPGDRVAIAVRYPPRGVDDDMMLAAGFDQLAEDLGATVPQRRLLQKVHPQLGRGDEIAATVRTVGGAMSRSFAVTYPVTSWETALRLGQGTVLSDRDAAEIPTKLGELAGALASDTTTGLELVLGPHEPLEILVWVKLAL